MPEYIDAFISPVRDNDAVKVALLAVLLLILLDVVLGVVSACLSGTFSSKKMREGISHKTGELGFLLVGLIVDGTIVGGIELGFEAPVMLAVCSYVIIMEIGSILEILVDMNPTLDTTRFFKMLAKTKKGDSNE